MLKSGFLIINKPQKITSFGVIAQLRKITGIKKIGHAGTLDPMATGVLICAIGREATRQIDKFQQLNKTYVAEIEFGKTSDTYDTEGKIETNEFKEKPKLKEIKAVVKNFIGEIEQMPPVFSAKKIKGQPAYKLARQGKKVELKSATVTIYKIKILKYRWPFLEIEIKCGKGTYIRSLAHDLGQELKVGGVLTKLIRTQIGDYDIKNSIELEKLNQDNWENCLI